MLYLFLSNLLLFLAFSGIGFLASRFTFLKLRRGNFFLNFFLGFSLSAIYFSFIQFFLPLNVGTLLPVLLAGLAGCIRYGRCGFARQTDRQTDRQKGIRPVI